MNNNFSLSISRDGDFFLDFTLFCLTFDFQSGEDCCGTNISATNLSILDWEFYLQTSPSKIWLVSSLWNWHLHFSVEMVTFAYQFKLYDFNLD